MEQTQEIMEKQGLNPGDRIIQVVMEEVENPKKDEDEFRFIEIKLEYLRDVLTYRQFDDMVFVQYTGWVCKDIETGEIGVIDPNSSKFYFDGESPLSKK